MIKQIAYVRSYAPIITGSVFGLGLATMPLLFGLPWWAYLLTLPIGFAGGVVAYSAVMLSMGDE